MREDLFDQYERFSFAYFDSHSSGDMMSRVVNDLFDICEALTTCPSGSLSAVSRSLVRL